MIDLKSMAVTMPEVSGHPNRVAFQGVLTMVEVASERPPSGARGHLVILTRKAAEAALPSLLGMGVDYSPALDRHDVRCKVGVITRAEIVGRTVELGGYLFARDFPEIVEEIANSGSRRKSRSIHSSRDSISELYTLHGVEGESKEKLWSEGLGLRSSLRAAAKQILNLTEVLGRHGEPKQPKGLNGTIRIETSMRAASKGLGMSYEVTDVRLANSKDEIWILEKVTFTGAAILRRDKAAYRNTWIELRRE